MLLEKLSLVRQPLKENVIETTFFVLLALAEEINADATRERKIPLAADRFVFSTAASPWQMITDLFFRCHHDLLVQCA